MLKQPTECNTYADIDAAYKCLKEQYGVKDEQLILYGQSVGSGPTLDLASHLFLIAPLFLWVLTTIPYFPLPCRWPHYNLKKTF